MAIKYHNDDGAKVTFDATQPIIMEALNERQIKQVREIIRQEIEAAIKRLIETGVIGD